MLSVMLNVAMSSVVVLSVVIILRVLFLVSYVDWLYAD